MPLELLIILLLVLTNGLFAGAEIAVLSVRKAAVLERAAARDGRGIAVQALRDQPERFLATVQIGITVVSSAAAVFGGASLARDLEPVLAAAGFGSHSGDLALGLVVALVSFLSLVLGELVPKSLALRYSSSYAFLVGRPLLWLSTIARPLVWLLTGCSNLVLRLFGDRTSFTEARTSREELQQLVKEAARSGSLDAKSGEIATRAIGLADVAVAELMVPRERIVALPRTASPELVQRVLLEEGHSRTPVYEGTLDRIVGYVVARDVLAMAWEQGLVVLDDILRPPLQVAASARTVDVLRQMQTQRIQMAMVLGEHGDTIGLVTLEDLVEELVGDILNEHDQPDEVVQREPTGTALVPGWAPIRKVNRALETALPIGRESTTIAGLCLALALVVPQAGVRLRSPDGTTIEVVEASSRRVRKVRIHRRADDDWRPGSPDSPDR